MLCCPSSVSRTRASFAAHSDPMTTSPNLATFLAEGLSLRRGTRWLGQRHVVPSRPVCPCGGQWIWQKFHPRAARRPSRSRCGQPEFENRCRRCGGRALDDLGIPGGTLDGPSEAPDPSGGIDLSWHFQDFPQRGPGVASVARRIGASRRRLCTSGTMELGQQQRLTLALAWGPKRPPSSSTSRQATWTAMASCGINAF